MRPFTRNGLAATTDSQPHSGRHACRDDQAGRRASLRDVRRLPSISPALRRTVPFLLLLSLAGCGESPRATLPPSATDLVLLKADQLCDRKTHILERMPPCPKRELWGSGESVSVPKETSHSGGDEQYFFDEDGILVATLFVFPGGLPLEPYPVLRRTLTELTPSTEFYLDAAAIPAAGRLETARLYMTGDEKTTTQYLTLGDRRKARLLAASIALDPYASLLSPYAPDVLRQFGASQTDQASTEAQPAAKEPFPSLQQFARGQTAQLGYCGTRQYQLAADAYRKAIRSGFSDTTWLAEAHHRLGLSLQGQGELMPARAQLDQALLIRPASPEILNNLGTLLLQLGYRDEGVAAFEKAVTLRPNYPLPRYNLAEAYEAINRKRALTEYETYLALAEGMPEEAERRARARERIKVLKH